MSDLVYARRTDNVAAAVTPVVFSGTTMNALYPLTRAIDLDPATAAKSSSTGDFRIVWDFTAAQRVDAVWIPMWNALAGVVARFEGHTSNTWGAPTVSRNYTVPAYGGDMPRGAFFDITAAAGYSTSGLRYWSLFVPNTAIITAIGEVFISSQKRTVKNLLVGVSRPRDRRVIRHPRQDGGLFQYDRGSDTFSIEGRVIVNGDDYSDYLALHEDARGSVYPFPVVIEPDATVPEGYLVQWVGGFRQTNRSAPNIEELSFSWQMVYRGRAL